MAIIANLHVAELVSLLEFWIKISQHLHAVIVRGDPYPISNANVVANLDQIRLGAEIASAQNLASRADG